MGAVGHQAVLRRRDRDVPLAYKDELWVGSHADTITVRVPDAPAPDEIVVIAALASRGRLHARLGGLSKQEAVAAEDA